NMCQWIELTRLTPSVDGAGLPHQKRTDLVFGHGTQPIVKTPLFRPVLERLDGPADLEENFLRQVCGVRILQAPAAAVAIDQRAVGFQEGLPSRGIARIPYAQQQTWPRAPSARVPRHRLILHKSQNLSALCPRRLAPTPDFQIFSRNVGNGTRCPVAPCRRISYPRSDRLVTSMSIKK